MRRFRFSLRSLILVVTALSCLLGILFWYWERESRLSLLASEATTRLFRAFENPPPELESGQVAPWSSPSLQNAKGEALYNFWEVERNVEFTFGNYQADYWRTRLVDRGKAADEIVRRIFDHFTEAFRPLGVDAAETKRTKLSQGSRTELKLFVGDRNVEAIIVVVDGPDDYFYVAAQTGRR